jgi:hypothetical protein
MVLLDTSKYALAVEIDSSLFEIFDILYFDKDSEIDTRYKSGTLSDAKGFYPKDNKKIKIGAFWNGSDFVSADETNYVEIDISQDIYVFTSQDIIFGAVIKDKNTLENNKYQAAFQSNIIIINVSSEDNIGLGDFWDGKKIISVVQ